MIIKTFSLILLLNIISLSYSADDAPADFSKSTANATDVIFYYFSANKPSDPQVIPGDRPYGDISDDDIDAFHIVLIHDHDENEKTKWITALRDFFLGKEHYNVVVVDWSKAGGDIKKSKNNVKFVADLTSKFLFYTHVPSSKIFEISLGFGAHIAGLAGKAYTKRTKEAQEKLLGIIALDPAASGFQTSDDSIPKSNRLTANDTQFTFCTHSNCQKYGYKKPICTVDFYLNNGNMQPGCKDDYCSHKRAAAVLVDSLGIMAYAVPAKVRVEKGKVTVTEDKSSEDEAVYGFYTPPDVSGTYQLKTNDKSPFLENDA